jgi:hypothetical protein
MYNGDEFFGRPSKNKSPDETEANNNQNRDVSYNELKGIQP